MLFRKSELNCALDNHEAVRSRFLEAVDILALFEGEELYSLSELSKQAVVIGESSEKSLALQEGDYFIVDFRGAVFGGD